jgi:DNA-binding LacI/PurR family transcriptional regulator
MSTHRDEARFGYQAIADTLREEIRNGRFAKGAFLPTERDLQSEYAVSRGTVRRALAALIESGWAEARPNRGVAAKLGPTVGAGGSVAFVDHADMVNERVFFGISQALQGTGFHLTLVDSRKFGLEGALEYALENGFAAAFVWSKVGFPDADRVNAIAGRMPVVAIDHGIGQVQTDLVCRDDLGGASLAVKHLASLGRTRIAVSGMMDMLSINHARFSGYLQGIFQSGLGPHPADFLFCLTSGYGSEETGLLSHRLRESDRPDAIFVLQDMCVPAVVDAVFGAGLRIPEDVAVASFGGEVGIQIDGVGLTTTAVDWHRFAEQCVDVLLRRIREPLSPCRQVSLPVSLLVLGSCGAPDDIWDPMPSAGVEVRLGSRWKIQDFLHMRSDAFSTP